MWLWELGKGGRETRRDVKKERQDQDQDQNHLSMRTAELDVGCLVQVFMMVEALLIGTRDRIFRVVVPLLWNTLPKDTCLAPALIQLVGGLKVERVRQA